MHTKGCTTLLVLAAVAAVAYAAPAAYADHPSAAVSNAQGSSVPGCEVTRECFIPADVTVDVGGEVTWTNDDTVAHTITSGTDDDGPDGVFDSGLAMPGASFKFVFDEAGEYPYFCIVHPWMEGTVTVSDSHGDDGDMMMMGSDGDVSATGMLPDGTPVELTATQLLEQRVMKIDVVFKESEHVNYDIMATQDGEVVLDDKDAHKHEGMGSHETMPLDLDPAEYPLDITVTFNGYGVDMDNLEGPTGDVVFTNIVPEFGTVAVLVLAVAIVSIIAVTARSGHSLVPRL